MSYLHHFKHCNLYQAEHFRPFVVNGSAVGSVKHAFADSLSTVSADFSLQHDALHWNPAANDFNSLNLSMQQLTDTLLEKKLLGYRLGELFAVTNGQPDQALFLMDRALVPYFGVRAFGQHLNGYVRRKGEIKLWMGRRSQTKRHAPGKLDHLVAGGLPWGLSLPQNLAKECWEEAGIPPELAAQARLTGTLSYRRETELGLKPDTLYCYDLELPPDFIPHCTDGEVESFELWPLHKVAQRIHDSDDIKLNCNLVMIDFLIRHGVINAMDTEYAELINQLNAARA
ncbi:MAG: DUF4743 domain-containing protein [Gammaproteobacteria bacterium]|nr:DUF4743 domain-containing protein [Gammaproteobacteria bacterium]MBL6999294.1 DUF4743 domain-containing protein [Gammaproteobacteria bacterium]